MAYCTISGLPSGSVEDANNDKYGDGDAVWVKTTSAPPSTVFLFPPKAVRTEDKWRHTAINVSSPPQFSVDHQSVGCICPEKRLQSMAIARTKPYLEYPDKPTRG